MQPALAERIHQARKALDLTQQGMADALDVSLRTYTDIERAVRPPRLEVFQALGRLGISDSWLNSGEGEMFTEARPLRDIPPGDDAATRGIEIYTGLLDLVVESTRSRMSADFMLGLLSATHLVARLAQVSTDEMLRLASQIRRLSPQKEDPPKKGRR